MSQQDQEKIEEKGEDDYVLARELEEQQSYLYDLSNMYSANCFL